METLDLQISLREEIGKGAAHRLRVERRLPGVFYGPQTEKPMSVSVNALEFAKVHKKARTNSLLKLQAEGDDKTLDGKLALLKEVQVHPVTDNRLHFDLYEVKDGEPFKLTIPVILEGKPKGIAEGGKLQQIRRSIDVKCLPKNIPTEIKVDVSGMDINESIHINDITLPEGVSMLGTSNITLASVVTPEKEDKKTDAAEGEEAQATPAA